ncbi:hypothetical protein ACUN7V_18140 [Quadrisphaera oryzae]|uniref:hypothetical protein n=1 Tax=Quadrisphaera TaxID=317661 RepID=UPI00164750A7|nr:hypothetical protein [Quadrisphaera sp. RL12-1S]MBC3760947.1 hypothetical protein [Quadrisphaera sp. RL12-1S]
MAAPGVWSTAWFSAAVRLLAVGVLTGALTASVLVLLVTALEGGTLFDGGGFLLVAALVGAACGVPTAVLCAATGLVVAARAPRRRGLVLGLLFAWPAAVTVLALTFVLSDTDDGPGVAALLQVVLLGLVAACVTTTRRWVVEPLHGDADRAAGLRTTVRRRGRRPAPPPGRLR